jgi:hypothetical protein
MKQIFLFISIVLIGIGAYLKLFYDVPDSQESINFFTSWFLIIIGISSLLINLVWNTSRKDGEGKG